MYKNNEMPRECKMSILRTNTFCAGEISNVHERFPILKIGNERNVAHGRFFV